MGEAKRKALKAPKPVAVDTFGGRIHVEWDPKAAVTPLGQLPLFIDFLKVSGVFDAWVKDCPLHYVSNNAPDKRDACDLPLVDPGRSPSLAVHARRCAHHRHP